MTIFQSPKPVRGVADPSPQDQQELGMQRWVEAQINGGMITSIEPANIPQSALQLAQNATVRYDRTARRAGASLFTPVRPDAYPVLALVYVKLKDGTLYTLRHTASSAQYLNGAAWGAFTFTAALHGTAEDRFQYVDVLNTYCFANNGADPIQAVDFTTKNIAQLGNAPAYRYITGFYNRVVGAALQGSDEVNIGWSGDGNPTEWNAATDQTAGSTPLIDTPADLSDWIKGIFAFSNVMVILREKSVWLATKQPIPTNPFYFYTAIPGIGCDCPYSAAMVNGGIVWADSRTKSIYAYAPGMPTPEPIGRPVEVDIFASLNDVNTIFSAYNATFDEYTLFIPVTGSNTVQGWTYNFRSKAWTYNEYLNITCAADFPIVTASLAIKDLVGTIAGLTGAINALSPTSLVDTRAYGKNTGDIVYEDVNADTDDGDAFDTLLTSKTFVIPSNDITIAALRFEYEALRVGTITIEFSKDDGNTWYTGKTVTPTTLNKATLLIYRRLIRCRRFIWRVRANAGAFKMISYEVWVYKDGESRR